ncbi:hypothetical protein EDEG_02150 [Edhazardia aedis USNM 41457]|uniref:DUF5094 domain-containing protein n=1 Tax=Edhazardia aedis (strain USNM 41457) TaxID=1003232 RepID=J9D7N0_EDHAE|nr:hypothetical protein EDEG_02150 [Edhazardia aedis USNM 41457]|eukprot:EJW03529.1 hypothetical protein EDEG_02150 [Edhazardia aedis USNM 41457]
MKTPRKRITFPTPRRTKKHVDTQNKNNKLSSNLSTHRNSSFAVKNANIKGFRKNASISIIEKENKSYRQLVNTIPSAKTENISFSSGEDSYSTDSDSLEIDEPMDSQAKNLRSRQNNVKNGSYVKTPLKKSLHTKSLKSPGNVLKIPSKSGKTPDKSTRQTQNLNQIQEHISKTQEIPSSEISINSIPNISKIGKENNIDKSSFSNKKPDISINSQGKNTKKIAKTSENKSNLSKQQILENKYSTKNNKHKNKKFDHQENYDKVNYVETELKNICAQKDDSNTSEKQVLDIKDEIDVYLQKITETRDIEKKYIKSILSSQNETQNEQLFFQKFLGLKIQNTGSTYKFIWNITDKEIEKSIVFELKEDEEEYTYKLLEYKNVVVSEAFMCIFSFEKNMLIRFMFNMYEILLSRVN